MIGGYTYEKPNRKTTKNKSTRFHKRHSKLPSSTRGRKRKPATKRGRGRSKGRSLSKGRSRSKGRGRSKGRSRSNKNTKGSKL